MASKHSFAAGENSAGGGNIANGSDDEDDCCPICIETLDDQGIVC